MTDRAINPKLLLAVGGVALVIFSAIAIFMAVGFSPDTGTRDTTTTTPSAVPAPVSTR